jgi:hypothetical protein
VYGPRGGAKEHFLRVFDQKRVIHGCRRKALGVNGLTQALRYLGPFFPLSGGCFPVLGAPQSPRLISPPRTTLVFTRGLLWCSSFSGRFLRKNASWRSRVSVHSLGRGRGALRKPIPLGVSCGVCYFLAVSLAKTRLGFIGVRSEAPGTIPGPPLICFESLYILDENLTFMIHHHSFLCFGAPPGSSLSMPFGFLACAAVHSLASRVRPGSKPVLRIRIPFGVSCGVR